MRFPQATRLQARAIYELIFFAHVGHNVFPLMPTAALHLHEAAEDLFDSGVEPFGAVDDAEQALMYLQTPVEQVF